MAAIPRLLARAKPRLPPAAMASTGGHWRATASSVPSDEALSTTAIVVARAGGCAARLLQALLELGAGRCG